MKVKPRMFSYESSTGQRWVCTDTQTIGMGSTMAIAYEDYCRQRTSELRWNLVLGVVITIVLAVAVHGMQ